MLTLLIVELENPYFLYLLPVLNANFFSLIEGLDFVYYGNQILSCDNTNVNVQGTSSSELPSGNLTGSSPRGNGQSPQPPVEPRGNGQSPQPLVEPANPIPETPDPVQTLVKRKLELQVHEATVNSGRRRLKPIFSTNFSDGAKLNDAEQRFIVNYIAARPESGYSPHTSFPNSSREKVIIQKGFSRGSYRVQATASPDFIRLF